MKDLLNFFDKPKDPISVEAVSIKMASPDTIREWSFGEVNQREMVFSVQKFLVLLRTMNVFAENTRE